MNLMDLRLITVDSFTQCRFGGNPAAIVPECEEVPQMYYPQIANEINLSQSAFIHRRSKDRFFIEFFTPTKAIKFSGHAAIGAFYTLSNMGYIRPIESGIRNTELELLDGEILDIDIEYNDYEVEKIGIKMPEESFHLEEEKDLTKKHVAEILRVEENTIKAVYYGGYFNNDIIVFVDSKETLDSVRPDYFDLLSISEDKNAGGIYIVYRGSKQEKSFAYARYFSPAMGLFEEAATGSAAATAGKIILDKTGKEEITVYQGQKMKRPSVINIIRDENSVILSGVGRIVTDSVMHL